MKLFKKLIYLLFFPIILSSFTACDNKEQFVMIGKITAINSHIEIEILQDEYNQGIMWVNYSSTTPIYNANNERINLSDLTVGNKIRIVYSGQVMMSYPGQIVAKKIILIN